MLNILPVLLYFGWWRCPSGLPVWVVAGDPHDKLSSNEEAWKVFQRGAFSVSRKSSHGRVALHQGSVCRKQFLFVGWACTGNTPALLSKIPSKAMEGYRKKGSLSRLPGPVAGFTGREGAGTRDLPPLENRREEGASNCWVVYWKS
jgi:hypothetical protein